MKQPLKMNGIFPAAFTFISLTIYSCMSYSQPSASHQDQGPGFLANIFILTEGQKDSFLTILLEQHEKRETIRSNYRASHEAELEEMKALHQDTLIRLQSVLSEEQIAQFDELTEKQHPPRPAN